ncbi:uncharacterized protein LOC124136148 [Haliotis rufescens]|uniref:uncharacterized protein LOC124136148 n=1 Tax=Haliotis rufescens TaxID=6454 RepID=UPI00201EA700|nr:uncharacterized protein LOC124136148 [Haliotis rufescens]
MYCKSPKAYSDFKGSGVLVLPSQRLLQYYKNSVKQSPGINEEHLTWMEEEAKKNGIEGFGRHGGLLLDEMQIQDDLQIVRRGSDWSLVGAVDVGPLCNNINILIKKKKSVQMATHVLQFVFHGLYGFRWPVAYFGTNPGLSHQIYFNFWKIVEALGDHDFIVDYVMLDGASTNRAFQTMLLGTKPSLLRQDLFQTTNTFDHHQISVCQDIKHVFKKLRNGLESSKLNFKSSKGRYLLLNTEHIIWEHWEGAFRFNVQNGLRVHYKLTTEHIELTAANKMRNKLATDVLDKNMLYLMQLYQRSLPDGDSLNSTIELLKITSPLVDLFHDTTRHVKSLHDERLTHVRQALKFFNGWEDQITSSTQHPNQKHLLTRETRDDFNSSLVGFISVCENLIPNGATINPGYFNSDLVENFFCQQRGVCHGLNNNPTLSQYGPAVNAVCIGQSTVSNKCNSGSKSHMFRATTPGPLRPSKKRKMCSKTN